MVMPADLSQGEAKYALAAGDTGRRHLLVFVAISATAATLVALLGASALRSHRLAGVSPLDAVAGVTERSRFMARVGAMSCALFLLLIMAQALADFFFEPGT